MKSWRPTQFDTDRQIKDGNKIGKGSSLWML
jgi:hypothetical protein